MLPSLLFWRLLRESAPVRFDQTPRKTGAFAKKSVDEKDVVYLYLLGDGSK